MENKTIIGGQSFNSGMLDGPREPPALAQYANAAADREPGRGDIIGFYTGLILFGTLMNVSMIKSLQHSRRRRDSCDSRNNLLTYLAVADLIYIWIVMPLEIESRTTRRWLAGNVGCKLLPALQAFGQYLISYIVVSINVDGFFTVVVYPDCSLCARKHCKGIIKMSWIAAFLCSLPQSLVFHVVEHPTVRGLYQCSSSGVLYSEGLQFAFNLINSILMIGLPLLINTSCHLKIIYRTFGNSMELTDPFQITQRNGWRRDIALAMTHAFCCVPDGVRSLRNTLDHDFEAFRTQELYSVLDDSKSCIFPIIYSFYAITLKSQLDSRIRNRMLNGSRLGRATATGLEPILNHQQQHCSRCSRHNVHFAEMAFMEASERREARALAPSPPPPPPPSRRESRETRGNSSSRSEIFTLENSSPGNCYNNMLLESRV